MTNNIKSALNIIEKSWKCIWIAETVVVLLQLGLSAVLAEVNSSLAISDLVGGVGNLIGLGLMFLCIRAMRKGSDRGLSWGRTLLWMTVFGSMALAGDMLARGVFITAIVEVIIAIPTGVLPLMWLNDSQFTQGFTELANANSDANWYLESSMVGQADVAPRAPSAGGFCTNCGTLLSGLFCASCGAKRSTQA